MRLALHDLVLMGTHPLLAGHRLGNYVIGGPIGEGASARVYEARHTRLGHCVAVKVVPRETTRPLRFEREVHALAAIRSRHVPQVHDVGVLPDGAPYVVMERLRGETLGELLERCGALDIEQTLEIGAQIAAALEAIHAAGWVHRDVKPNNVVLHQEGDGQHVAKLYDFGIAYPLPDAPLQSARRGSVDGTPEYMSPEQARGFPVGPASDVFSLGSVIYEMLVGRSPFEHGNATPEAIALAVTRDEPQPIPALRPDCPAWLAAVVHRALAKDCRRRFASATELRVALRNGLVAQEPLPLVRPRRDPSLKLPLRWGWRSASLGLAISAMAIGTWMFAARRSTEASPASPTASSTRTSTPTPALELDRPPPAASGTRVFLLTEPEPTRAVSPGEEALQRPVEQPIASGRDHEISRQRARRQRARRRHRR
jgi:serine/threonine-protein kinase